MSDEIERRNFIQGIGLLAGAAAAAGIIDQSAVAQTAQ